MGLHQYVEVIDESVGGIGQKGVLRQKVTGVRLILWPVTS